MSEMDAAGSHVDGPVVEGGEWVAVKMEGWGAFDTDRVPELLDATWEWAAVVAELHEDWCVMFVQESS